MTDNHCMLVAKPHPFDADTVCCEFRAGMTIAEMLGRGVAATASVECGGYPVPREAWPHVRPKAGVTLHVVVYPQGGNGGKWLKLIIIAVISYFTMGAGSAAAAAWLGVGTTTLGVIGMVAIMAVNALIPPPTPKGLGGSNGDPFDQLNSLTGTSNQTNPYGVIPCVVGSFRFFPPHAALPYTEISGDDQYLRMLLDLGYGDLDISDIRIGETDIATFEDVEWEISTAPSLFTQDIYELGVGVALVNTNDTATRTTQAATQEISLDIVFSNGLFGVNKKGATTTGTVSFNVQYRPLGGTWVGVGSATGLTLTGGMKSAGGALVTVNSAKKKTLRCGIRWTVPAGQYEVAVTRGPSSFADADGAKVGDAAWSVLRSVNPQVPSTTDTLKLAVRIRATDQLNGVVQTLSVLATQKVRQWDRDSATWQAAAGSTNPAWIYHWLMTDCPAVMRRLTDDRMDTADIADWADECTAKGISIGFVMDSGRALGDVLRDVLAAGRATFGLRNSLYSAVRDLPQTVPMQMFTPANSWDFSYKRDFMEPPHALRVNFTNPEAGYQQDVVLVYWDGYSETGAAGTIKATRFEELDLRMIIDPAAAWKLGRYHLAVIYNRMTQYTFSADIEHMVCERGDLISHAHDITGWGVAWGRINAIAGSTVTLDGPVTLASGKTYQFRVRKDDLAQAAVNITSPAGDVQVLTLASAISGAQVGDLYEVGEVCHGVAQFVVRTIEPGEDLTAVLTCVDAAPEVLTADAGTPPPFVSAISGKSWCAAPPPPVVTIRAGDSAPDDAGIIRAVTGISSDPKGGLYRFPVGGGGGCVVVDSFLGDMRHAGDVAPGDAMDMADPDTLAPRQGVVTYSEPVMQPCVELITASGIVLRCSLSAPIPTERDGVVLAPQLAGKSVGVRDGNSTRWEPVTRIRSIGMRWVQHISVNDGCFWAGAEQGRFILHHNKKAREPNESRIERML